VAPQPRDRAVDRADGRLALGDDEEPGPGRAAADDRSAGVVEALGEARRELGEVVVGQPLEQLHAAQQVDRDAHGLGRPS
jgi:hypothetical protein